MSEIVNLNRVRKNKARAAKKARADENSVRFGQTKAEKALAKTKNELASRNLDGHKREE